MEVMQMLCFQAIAVYCELVIRIRMKKLYPVITLLFPGPFFSGPMWAYILAHENAISLWRSLMGPTKVFRARNCVPDSIRGAYGLTDTRNTTHGSGRSSWLGAGQGLELSGG